MSLFKSRAFLRYILLTAVVALNQFAFTAEENIRVTEVTPTALVFSTSSGNVVASVGPDGALLIGTPSAASTSAISKIIANRTKSSVRYVVIFPEALARSEEDAGWGRRGAFVSMQENALRRLGGDVMGPPKAAPAHFAELGVSRPPVAFSEVLSFDLNGEAIHVVHQKPGYSDADAIAHFHAAKLVYLGEVFPGDGYPEVDPAQGGTLEGLLATLESWAGGTMHVVPARGAVTDAHMVKTYQDMIVSIRDRVQMMMKAGKSEADIVAAHPTAKFDPQWGHGRVTPEQFVHEVYVSLKK